MGAGMLLVVMCQTGRGENLAQIWFLLDNLALWDGGVQYVVGLTLRKCALPLIALVVCSKVGVQGNCSICRRF